MQTGSVILISGWRQVGKTTVLLAVWEQARRLGLRCGGFLSVARFEERVKMGIDLMDTADGSHMPLATMGQAGSIRTGHYSFNPAALEAGLHYAEVGQDADVFFVDELGPLELVRGAGWAAVIPLIRARAYGVAFVVVRPELLDAAREQMSLLPDTPLVMIDVENRDARAKTLTRWLALKTRK